MASPFVFMNARGNGIQMLVCTEFTHCSSFVDGTECSGDNGWSATDPYHPESTFTLPSHHRLPAGEAPHPWWLTHAPATKAPVAFL
mmetsp:Transcript_10397/g.14973  ORF Transcript_10397/g.14973 Transcript_10397/m.14973 type:complete len:86 (+) Transcript_10397:52-309(+)